MLRVFKTLQNEKCGHAPQDIFNKHYVKKIIQADMKKIVDRKEEDMKTYNK